MKRQGRHRRRSLFFRRAAILLTGAAIVIAAGWGGMQALRLAEPVLSSLPQPLSPLSFAPVSYTHLDVYKRQERGCSAALDQFSLPVFAAVSAIHETIYSLPVAYGEAREALSYRIIRSDPVLLYHEFHEEAGGSLRSVFSPELQRKLSNCVRAADVEQSRGLIRDITESLAKDESCLLYTSRCV